MSTPVAVAAAIGSAGKRGLLIKGGVHLENLGRVQVVAFDKTDTLTSGNPTVTDVIGVNGNSPAEVLRLAATVEADSEHPLGRAIVKHAHIQGVETRPVVGFRAHTGAGAQAQVDGTTAYVGKPQMLLDNGFDLGSTRSRVNDLQTEGKTVVMVGIDRKLAGLIALRDQPRPNAAKAVAALHQMGIGHVVMLTGDNRAAAAAGAITVAVAVTVHEVAEIIAVLNGLRARIGRQPETG